MRWRPLLLLLPMTLASCGADDDGDEARSEAPSEATTKGDISTTTTETTVDEGNEDNLEARIGTPFVYSGETITYTGSGEPGPPERYEVTVTVTGVECGKTEVGGEALGVPAERSQVGQFCVVRMDQENTGDVPKKVSGVLSKLLDSQGRSYNPSIPAQTSLELGEDISSNPLNPTQRGPSTLVFDVPPDAEPDTLMLQENFGDPVKPVLLAP